MFRQKSSSWLKRVPRRRQPQFHRRSARRRKLTTNIVLLCRSALPRDGIISPASSDCRFQRSRSQSSMKSPRYRNMRSSPATSKPIGRGAIDRAMVAKRDTTNVANPPDAVMNRRSAVANQRLVAANLPSVVGNRRSAVVELPVVVATHRNEGATRRAVAESDRINIASRAIVATSSRVAKNQLTRLRLSATPRPRFNTSARNKNQSAPNSRPCSDLR